MRIILLALALAAVPDVSLAQHADDPATHAATAPAARGAAALAEQGQAAFAAIAEVVAALEADPQTDWSRVDLERLRRHLIDMDNAILSARVESREIAGGARFSVTGSPAVAASLRRMAAAHAQAMNGAAGWVYAVHEVPGGVELDVTGPDRDTGRIRGLGFAGILARGGHHQAHHYAIASGIGAH